MTNNAKPDYYEHFARWFCRDLAERRDQHGNKLPRGHRRTVRIGAKHERLPLSGTTICYSNGCEYRDSDASMRLTMIVSGLEQAELLRHGSVTGRRATIYRHAAQMVLDSPLRSHFLVGRRGRKPKPRQLRQTAAQGRLFRSTNEWRDSRFEELDAQIAEERRGRPSESEGKREIDRLAEIIRVQVSAFRRRRPQWQQMFHGWFGAFRMEFYQTQEWYAEMEAEYRRRVECANDDCILSANATAVLGDLLTHVGKYEEAEQYFARSLDLWKALTDVPEERRCSAIRRIEAALGSVHACQARVIQEQ